MRIVLIIAALSLTLSPAFAQEGRGTQASTPAPIVFFDIAGKQANTLSEFYSQIFGWQIAPDGRFTAQVKSTATTPLPGQIRQDPPEKRVYLGVPDVTATLNAIKAKGGTIDAARFAVPGVVVLGLFKDPEGNAMGLVEMDGYRVKIP